MAWAAPAVSQEPPADVLQLAGLEPSEAAVLIASGSPAADRELVLRLAWRARSLSHRGMLESPALLLEEAGTPVADWGDHRFRLVSLRGSVRAMEPWRELDPDADPPFLRLQLVTGQGTAVTVVASAVPSAWTKNNLPMNGVRITGFLAGPDPGTESVDGRSDGGSAEAGQSGRPWLVVCDRVEWYPEPGSAAVAPGAGALARAGLDAGLLDQVRKAGVRPLLASEMEAWRAMVQAAARIDRRDWEQLASNGAVATITDLLRQPGQVTARPVRFRGTLRRVSNVSVDSEAGLRVRQLDFVTDAGTDLVAITNPAGERMEFGSRIPVTVILEEKQWKPELAKGMVLEVSGFAYRFWTYESGLSQQQEATSGQTLPLVMGWQVQPVETGRETIDRVMYWLLAGFLALIGLVGIAVAWMNRRDRRSGPPRGRTDAPVIIEVPD